MRIAISLVLICFASIAHGQMTYEEQLTSLDQASDAALYEKTMALQKKSGALRARNGGSGMESIAELRVLCLLKMTASGRFSQQEIDYVLLVADTGTELGNLKLAEADGVLGFGVSDSSGFELGELLLDQAESYYQSWYFWAWLSDSLRDSFYAQALAKYSSARAVLNAARLDYVAAWWKFNNVRAYLRHYIELSEPSTDPEEVPVPE